MKSRRFPILAALMLFPLVAGCDRTSVTNAGLTNGPPPTTSTAKASVRNDIAPAGNPDRGEALGELGDNQSNAGSGGMGSGTEGGGAGVDLEAGNPNTVRATPETRGSTTPSSAAGGTKPVGEINTGTPRSPQ